MKHYFLKNIVFNYLKLYYKEITVTFTYNYFKKLKRVL